MTTDNRAEPQLVGHLCSKQQHGRSEVNIPRSRLDQYYTGFPSPAVCTRYNDISDSDSCVKMMVTRSIKQVADKVKAKLNYGVPISWTPADTNAAIPFAKANAAADQLAARGCGTTHLNRSSSFSLFGP